MTDKIITTFLTMITWFCPQDKLPMYNKEILIKMKNGDMEIGAYEKNSIFYAVRCGHLKTEHILW